jgi:hypothetical protein
MALTADEVAELTAREESLWRPGTRYDDDYMTSLLHPDFVEFGRSGRRYGYGDVLVGAGADFSIDLPLPRLTVQELVPGTALVTYLSVAVFESVEYANRTSVWLRTTDGWRLRFHQGTATSADGDGPHPAFA